LLCSLALCRLQLLGCLALLLDSLALCRLQPLVGLSQLTP
jgi:hypothetical protein